MNRQLSGLGVIIATTAALSYLSFQVAAKAVDGIFNKVVAGYQGWFCAEGDSSPASRWVHWAGSEPSPGNQTFELYPYLAEYSPKALFDTGYAPLGNGRPAKLFSSHGPGVVDTHFKWMSEYGIDCAALQRFGTELEGNRDKLDAVAVAVKQSAERHRRSFYVMYDISGMGSNWVSVLKDDWENDVVRRMGLDKSESYATEGGRPVVCIWGAGFSGRIFTPEETRAAINWFKDMGCYVIGGVPAYWRTGNNDSSPGFLDAYCTFDAISPWTVGRFGSPSEADAFYVNRIKPDIDFCKSKGLGYLPVTFPGFAWSNWNGGAKNQIPRAKGELFWRQAANLQKSGLKGAYIAMFDEYDEATAIAKAAEDSSMIPGDQYFLTLSSDGVYVSADFYLRLAGAMGRLLKGQDSPSPTVPIPLAAGPTYFRSSFELSDARLTRPNDIAFSDGVGGPEGTADPVCAIERNGPAHRGKAAVKVWGETGDSGGKVLFRAVKATIPVSDSTVMGYWFRPETEAGRLVQVDLLFDDGTSLSLTKAVDNRGLTMGGNGARGRIGQWSQVVCKIGPWAKGRTIQQICIKMESIGTGGPFLAYIDDLAISDAETEFATKATPGEGVQGLKHLGMLSKEANADGFRLLSRGEAIKLVLSVLGVRQEQGSPPQISKPAEPFSDVDEVLASLLDSETSKSIVKGVGNGRFNPEQPATPRHLTTWYLRHLGYDRSDTDIYAVVDSSESMPGSEGINECIAAGRWDEPLSLADAVSLSVAALATVYSKGTDTLMARYLANGVVDEGILEASGLSFCAGFSR